MYEAIWAAWVCYLLSKAGRCGDNAMCASLCAALADGWGYFAVASSPGPLTLPGELYLTFSKLFNPHG